MSSPATFANQTTGMHSILFIDDINNIGTSYNPSFSNDSASKLNMYRHTYDSWHMVPTKRPSIAPPSIKTKYSESSAADGDTDLTDVLAGRVLYGNRVGEIEFMILNGYNNWAELYTELLLYFHGQTRDMILEDDPAYFYRGRFELGPYDAGDNNSTITLKYNLSPYKRDINTYIQNWLWDPFNFETSERTTETITEEFTLQAGTTFASRTINMPPTSAAYLSRIITYERKSSSDTFASSICRLSYTDRLGVVKHVNLYNGTDIPFTQFDKTITLNTNSFTISCTKGKVYVRLFYNLGML